MSPFLSTPNDNEGAGCPRLSGFVCPARESGCPILPPKRVLVFFASRNRFILPYNAAWCDRREVFSTDQDRTTYLRLLQENLGRCRSSHSRLLPHDQPCPPGCETRHYAAEWTPALKKSLFRSESQQNVAGYFVVMSIAGVHEHHTAGYGSSGAIQGAAFGGNLVDRGKFAQGVVIPQHVSVLA